MNWKKILMWIGIIFVVIVLLGVIKKVQNKPSTEANFNLTGCGNGACEDDKNVSKKKQKKRGGHQSFF